MYNRTTHPHANTSMKNEASTLYSLYYAINFLYNATTQQTDSR
jgi:hypothetical protein